MKNFFVTVILMLLFGICSQVINAQQIGLSINPPLHEVKIKPGKQVILPYKITNNGDPATIQIKIVGTKQKDIQGTYELRSIASPEAEFQLVDQSISLEKPFFLNSKETKDINVNITFPINTPLQDYYYAFLVETIPPPTTEGSTQLRVKNTIGGHIITTVTTKEFTDRTGDISLFAIKPRFNLSLFGKQLRIFNRRDSIPVYLTVENQSDTYMRSQGSLTIAKRKGSSRETIESHSISPRIIQAHSQRLLQTNEYQCTIPENKNCSGDTSLVFELQKIGIYDITARVSFDDNKTFQSTSITFLIIPLWELVAIFCTIIALVILFLLLNNTKKL